MTDIVKALAYFFSNIVLKAFVIIALNWLGLFTLMKDGQVATGAGELFSVAFGGALIFTLASALLFLCTLGLARLLFVFYGWGVLVLMSHIAPGFIELTGGFWLTALAGLIIGMFNASGPFRR